MVMDEEECTFAYQVVPRPGYVFVMQSGCPKSEDKVRRMQSEIDAALRAGRATRVMFDNRDTQAPPPWLQAVTWSWIGNHPYLTRVALIEEDEDRRRRTLERATRAWRGISMSWVGHVEIMAFTAEAEADAWVGEGPVAQGA